MENGLTVFAAENHTVPLVYIEIAIRAGAITQTPQTAGLFHLYEHMMFKGNKLYKDAASVNRALSNLGVASWNGTTGINHVNYFSQYLQTNLKKDLHFGMRRFALLFLMNRNLKMKKSCAFGN